MAFGFIYKAYMLYLAKGITHSALEFYVLKLLFIRVSSWCTIYINPFPLHGS